jgi:hypothetical protein
LHGSSAPVEAAAEPFGLAKGVEQSRFRSLDARWPNIGKRNGRWK